MKHNRFRMFPRFGFGLRLFTTLALTLCITGVIQFTIVSRAARQHLVSDASMHAQSDTIMVREAFDSGTDVDQRNQMIQEHLQAIAERPGITSALLIDSSGNVINASNGKFIGTHYNSGNPLGHSAKANDNGATTSNVGVSVVEQHGNSYYSYSVPVHVSAGTFMLDVQQSKASIEDDVNSEKRSSFEIALLGIAIGALLFFLLGGRSLASMHRKAQLMSSRDGLTGLENHITFKEALTQMTHAFSRGSGELALAIFDIDDFKLVNDRSGHRQGDELIKLASSLLITGRAGDRSFRIGGDEFAILLPLANQKAASDAIQRIWQQATTALDGVTLSVGIASLKPGMTHTDLQDQADHALYEAKRRGRNMVVVFEDMEDETVVPSTKIEATRRIIRDGKMKVAFQPIWDLQNNRILGFETLARPDDEYGLNGPAELFHIGEMIGRTAALDKVVWNVAMHDARQLEPDTLLFLNLSPFTADKGNQPIDELIEIVASSAFEPSRIVVEITERVSTRRDLIVEQAERLRAAGFLLALDDVGAGSGDLEMMARVKANFIKIDLAIVQRAVEDSTARGVFFAIIEFARHTNGFVIAEGIEDEATLQFVMSADKYASSAHGVRGAQGYLLGRPAPGNPIATSPGHRSIWNESRSSV